VGTLAWRLFCRRPLALLAAAVAGAAAWWVLRAPDREGAAEPPPNE
jgi:hypothetical protein